MADSAAQTQYRQEFIAGFEQHASLLRDTVTNEAVIKGNTAVFLVADSNGASAVTRGVNGLIPANVDNLTQNSCTLAEWHDRRVATGFNIFESQGDRRRIMQANSMAVMNRKIDSDIIGALANATHTTGTAVTGSISLILKARTILGNNAVPFDGNITLLATPALLSYLEQAPEFSNAQYVSLKPFEGSGAPDFRDAPMAYRWRNLTIIEHPNLTGAGTASETCFMYHRSSIGHAVDKAGLQSVIGYEQEHDYSYARTTMFMGSKLLQNNGVVVINHDGSAYVAS